MHRRARGQRELPQCRGPLSHVRPLGRGHGAGAGGHGVRIAALGEAESERARRRRDRNRCGRGWCRRVDPGQHAARPCPRPRDRAARCSVAAEEASRAPHSTPSPSAPSGSAGPPSRTCPSSGVGGVGAGTRRRRVAPSRGRRGPGGNGHLPRPAGTVEGAARAGALVRIARDDSGPGPTSRPPGPRHRARSEVARRTRSHR